MKRVLFVCVENSNRSQMSEAFARIHGAQVLEAHSAGSRPSGVVSSRAIQAMAEIGYDLSTHMSKSIDDVPKGRFDYVITMGCGDACPWIPATEREDWPLPDPGAMPPEVFNTVRDEVEHRVRDLIERVTKNMD